MPNVATLSRTQIARPLHGLVHDGDSISASTASLPTFPFRYAPKARARTINYAITGAQIATGTNNIVNRANAVIAKRPKAVTIFIGANDLGDLTDYPATSDWLNALWSYTARIKSALPGVKIAVGTILNRGDDANLTARRTDANTGIRAGVGTNIDAVFDFAADPIMGLDATVNDTTYWQADTIHPNEYGQSLLEEIYRPIANQLLGINDGFAGYSASSAGANPHALTQFTHYWDAGDENTVMGAAYCAQINDQIGSLHLKNTNATKFPQSKSDGLRVNGLNTILCGSVGNMVSTSTAALTDEFHVFFAIYHENNVNSSYYLSLAPAGLTTPRISLLCNTAPNPIVQSSGVGTASITGSGGIPTGPALYELVGKPGSYLKLFRNGVQLGSSATGYTGWGGTPVSVQLFCTTNGTTGGAGRFMAMGIAGSELTGTTLTDTQNFFRTRWNIY